METFNKTNFQEKFDKGNVLSHHFDVLRVDTSLYPTIVSVDRKIQKKNSYQ